MQEFKESVAGGSPVVRERRSVEAILSRRRAETRRRRVSFPPDFLHGAVAVGDIYDVLGPAWVERAIFVAGMEDVVSVAYFDDYFLVVEQWVKGESEPWGEWWSRRLMKRDRIVALVTGDCAEVESLSGVGIRIERERLVELEQALLGVVRDGFTDEVSQSGRLRKTQIDVLSLLTLTTRLSEE